MTQELIDRYQQGGDIYQSLVSRYGQAKADEAAAAAALGDETAINAALAGAPLNTSTLDIFARQIYNNPFAAPIEQLDKIAKNSISSLFTDGKTVVFLIGIGICLFAVYVLLRIKKII